MSEYIKREDALDKLYLDHKDVTYIDKNAAAKRIEKIQGIDIVFCKECRYWDNEPFDNKTIGRCLLVKDYMNMATIEEAYCFGGKVAEQTERSE